VFVSEHDPNRKGNVAELKIAAEAARLGIPVLQPMTEHERYDLVFEVDGELKRVQCKSAPRRGDVVVVRFVTNRRGPNGLIRTKYTSEEIDAVAAYCPEVDECYYLPMSMIEGMTGVHLRLAPTRNGQRAAVHFAAEYRLGAVAQLGRACGWQPQGRGFESHQLQSSIHAGERVVGAEECRLRLGHYTERAAAGESFLITRRGKAYARLSPPQDQLEIPAEPPEPEQPEPAEVVPITTAKERSA
jgi:antitoxin (DNA-binding transcriptional repressor) of toxin-antitoxin stability system